ncbi:MAG: carbohydrate ABC transporter permease [Spirochaetales bacterium]|nr:carbohydrate ABC transporter permease [Spirochaetales bacterium]
MSDIKTRLHHMFRWHRINAFFWNFMRSVLVIGICFLILYPLFIKTTTAFMEERDMYDVTVTNIPKHLTLSNFRLAFMLMDYGRAFLNSVLLSTMVSVLQLASCTLTAYGFARYKFPGRDLMFGLVILVLIVPPQTISIPMFMSFRYFNPLGFLSTGFRGINLLDSLWPYAFIAATAMGLKNGLYIYIIRQVFRGMPKSLEESAFVDGAGHFKIFYKIMLPGAIPIMTTTFLFSFVWQWTDGFYAGVLLKSLVILPKSLGSLSRALGMWLGRELGTQMVISPALTSQVNNAGTLIMVLPLLVIYLFAQKSFVESIDRSGIVG